MARRRETLDAGAGRDPLTAVPGDWLSGAHPAEEFPRGAVLIENTFLQTGASGAAPVVAYIHEGLVRGVWHRDKIAPASRATALVAGDGCWIGVDAFKFGENTFRYVALAPTTASLLPLAKLRDEAPRAVVVHAMANVSRDWCTAVALLSLGNQGLARRALVLLHHLSRVHPRPEIEVRHQDLSDMLGVSRQTLQPVLKDLETRGLIDFGYGEIVVADSERLFAALRRVRGAAVPGGGAEAGPRPDAP